MQYSRCGLINELMRILSVAQSTKKVFKKVVANSTGLRSCSKGLIVKFKLNVNEMFTRRSLLLLSEI